jgi:hypothetical protein
MNDREFSDIEIFQHSGKEEPLFMAGQENCLQADYLLGPGPRFIKNRIYRAAVSQRFRNTDLDHNCCLPSPGSRSSTYITVPAPSVLITSTYLHYSYNIWRLQIIINFSTRSCSPLAI